MSDDVVDMNGHCGETRRVSSDLAKSSESDRAHRVFPRSR